MALFHVGEGCHKMMFHVGEVCLTLNGIVSCGGGVSDVKWHYFMWGRGVRRKMILFHVGEGCLMKWH